MPESLQEQQKFQTPEEEIRFLREQVASKERELVSKGQEAPKRETLVSEQIRDYGGKSIQEVLEEKHRIEENEAKGIALDLTPEAHDTQMETLMGIVAEKGIKNTLAVVEKMGNPHIEDDFHRFLVQYVKKGLPVEGIKHKGSVWSVLHMTLYEITFPSTGSDKGEKPLRELLSGMEQLYAGLLSHKSSTIDHFTFEIALADGSDEIVFYASVPDSLRDLFEKQLVSLFPSAQAYEQKNDYNVFVSDGVSMGARGTIPKHGIFPLRTYDLFDHDPLNVILSAFSKIEKEGGGAAIQFVFQQVGGRLTSHYKEILQKVERGVSVKEALKTPESIGGEILQEFTGIFLGGKKKKKEDDISMASHVDQTVVEQMRAKISSRIVPTNVRIVASAKEQSRAEEILMHLTSAFSQFENTQGNQLTFSKLSGATLKQFFRSFSFREFYKKHTLPLSLKELTTLVHFPVSSSTSSHQLREAKTGVVGAPVTLPQEGTLLGVNRYQGGETKIYLTKEDRLRHFYCIGQTGTGKTTLLKNMIVQDIEQGEGVCMIDPHGTDIQDILGRIPKNRHDDVIYFDPSNLEHVMGLNMLEYDERYPEQKTFVVNELFSIFQKLYGAVPESMGPMFEQYFRNATMLVLEDPATGSTLLDVSRVLADSKYRAVKLAACNNPIVSQFWNEIATKAGGESSLANIVPYITSKFDIFTANDYMRPIIAQQKSAFHFRKIMDERKILLVNLAKGRLGDINANLLGLIIVGKFLMAALSRVDAVGGADLAPFYLYIDEFQNVTTDSIGTILSEARKYKLSLTVAHQFIAQLDQKIRDAVFGNVGSIVAFRVGSEDAEFLEKQFAPTVTAKDLSNIENRNAYVRLLANGEPQKPFSMAIPPPGQGNSAQIEALKQYSYTKYGCPRQEIEDRIRARYKPL